MQKKKSVILMLKHSSPIVILILKNAMLRKTIKCHLGIWLSGNLSFQKVLPLYEGVGWSPDLQNIFVCEFRLKFLSYIIIYKENNNQIPFSNGLNKLTIDQGWNQDFIFWGSHVVWKNLFYHLIVRIIQIFKYKLIHKNKNLVYLVLTKYK